MIILLTILFPLTAGALILISRKKLAAIGVAGVSLTIVTTLYTFIQVRQNNGISFSWAGLPDLPFRLLADPLGAVVSLAVAVVSSLVLVYAVGYMAEEAGKKQFWASMCLFIASMQLLVLADDWVLLLTAWEMMGLASYLLIGTWFWEDQARRAATKAFLLTRATDLGLYMGVFVIMILTGTTRISAAPNEALTWGAIALLVAVMGKSAQLPFQTWLADAMAGPTPVSALLHSATMVAAGVVLLLRAFPLLSPAILPVIGLVGGLTILATGITAMASQDIKRMLAASTSSQLGFMLLALGAGYPGAAIAHLVTHAFMKSALFLGAGIFQHAYDATDFNTLGGTAKRYKLTFTGFAVAGIALAGIPPLAGFWSKDAILAASYQTTHLPFLLFSLAAAGTFLTAFYIARALKLLWKGTAAEGKEVAKMNWMQAGLLGLVVMATLVGFAVEPISKFVGKELPKDQLTVLIGLILAVGGLLGGWWLGTKRIFSKATDWIADNYRLDAVYHYGMVRPVLLLAGACDRLDRYLHRLFLSFAGLFGMLRRSAQSADAFLHHTVQQTGIKGLALSRFSRYTDDEGIETAIHRLALAVRKLGQQGRKLQSGLVHRELLWAVSGLFIFILMLFLTLIL